MKAISQTRFGGPEVLATVEVPTPAPRTTQVLIRMGATSVNPVDWKRRAGRATAFGEPPFTLGFDVSGTVVEVGAEVTRFRPGDEVFGMIHSRTGTYSEYVLASADTLAPRPPSLDHVLAAALSTAGLTAWQALELSGLRHGERVLIHAAAGGVGHVAVQLAAHRGAHVVGTARTANHAFLRTLGVAETIDYTAVDFVDAAGEVDVVLDLVGRDYGQRSLRVLASGGRYVSTQESDAEGDARAQRLTARPSPEQLGMLGKLCDSGQLRVHVDRVLSLADVAEAHRLAESGQLRGKIALTPW